MARRRPSKRSSVPTGVTVTPPDVRDRVIAEALRVADERLAAHPIDNDRLEACAAEWLGEVLKSDAYLRIEEAPAPRRRVTSTSTSTSVSRAIRTRGPA
jgi:hypothetical protein